MIKKITLLLACVLAFGAVSAQTTKAEKVKVNEIAGLDSTKVTFADPIKVDTIFLGSDTLTRNYVSEDKTMLIIGNNDTLTFDQFIQWADSIGLIATKYDLDTLKTTISGDDLWYLAANKIQNKDTVPVFISQGTFTGTDLVVSGNTEYNGTYTYIEDYNGEPSYQQIGVGWIYYTDFQAGAWCINTTRANPFSLIDWISTTRTGTYTLSADNDYPTENPDVTTTTGFSDIALQVQGAAEIDIVKTGEIQVKNSLITPREDGIIWAFAENGGIDTALFAIEANGVGRFAIPIQGAGFATQNYRSLLVGSNGIIDLDSACYVGYAGFDIDFLPCNTDAFGADLGVEHNAQIKGSARIDSSLYLTNAMLSDNDDSLLVRTGNEVKYIINTYPEDIAGNTTDIASNLALIQENEDSLIVHNSRLIALEGAGFITTETDPLFDSKFTAKTTDDLAEGITNLYSQWKANGADIYYDEGNVGINTISPSYPLQINQPADYEGMYIYGYDDLSSTYGAMYIDPWGGFVSVTNGDGVYRSTGYQFFKSINDNIYFNIGEDKALYIRDKDSNPLVRINENNGYMGVLTTPTEALDVSGNIKTDEDTLKTTYHDWAYIYDAPAFITTETDPVWTADKPNYYTSTQVNNLPISTFTNDVPYLTSYTETDPIYSASSWFSTVNNSGQWDDAYDSIPPLRSDINANAADIASNLLLIQANNSSISSNYNLIQDNADDIASNLLLINSNATDITSNYNIIQIKQNYADTLTYDATRWWVGLQEYLNVAAVTDAATTQDSAIVIEDGVFKYKEITTSGGGLWTQSGSTINPVSGVSTVEVGADFPSFYASGAYANITSEGKDYFGITTNGTIITGVNTSNTINNNTILSSLSGFGITSSPTSITQTNAAYINMVAAESWTSTAVGTKLQMYTIPTGTTTAAKHLEIDGNGDVIVTNNLDADSITDETAISFNSLYDVPTYDNYDSWRLWYTADNATGRDINSSGNVYINSGNGINVVNSTQSNATYTWADVNIGIAANGVGADELNVTGDGTAGYSLTSDGDGSFSWTDISGGGGTPAGSDGYIQYNNGGSFGGANGLYYDDVNNRVGINTTSPSFPLQINQPADYEGMYIYGYDDLSSTYGAMYIDPWGSFVSVTNGDGVYRSTGYQFFKSINDNIYFNIGTNKALLIRDDGSTPLVAVEEATGAMGIGTTTPTSGYKLDVNGDAIIQGNTRMDYGDKLFFGSSSTSYLTGASGTGVFTTLYATDAVYIDTDETSSIRIDGAEILSTNGALELDSDNNAVHIDANMDVENGTSYNTTSATGSYTILSTDRTIYHPSTATGNATYTLPATSDDGKVFIIVNISSSYTIKLSGDFRGSETTIDIPASTDFETDISTVRIQYMDSHYEIIDKNY